MQFISKITRNLIKEKCWLYKRKVFHIVLQRNKSNTVPPLPLGTGYQPKEVELNKWRHLTEDTKSNKKLKGSFRMILPPPNVTGKLHLGHALTATVQDVICRQKRQLGYEVEWIPGTDHAGIATQVVVEKNILKESGLSRHQLGRDKFLKEVWKWKRDKGDGIVFDLKKLGCTLNWDKQYFTMDKASAVNLAFVKLFEDGLINRRNSMVNWSCTLESAISDIEVETMELKGSTELSVPGHERNVEFGRLYDISYRICDTNDEIIVSTTRPETLLGDVAVAVNPKDERYIKFGPLSVIRLWHPFRKESIPLIFDNAVEPEFGTGAVKITPAHDKLDFEIATRHLLEPIPVFTDQGLIHENFEDFAGLPRFEAREHVLNALSEMQLLRSIKDHAMNLPICSRSNDIIEYMLRPQWYIHCQTMADAAMAEVRNGRLQIVPSDFETEWYRWLENCHDWCISRQLWWGHQVPAYFATSLKDGSTCWVAALNEDDALSKAKEKLKDDKVKIEQDKDVLDTWFSSALLPFSVFNWPAPEYMERYPLDLMETGHDILFFWVARMTMLGIQLTGKAPFKKILLNGIVCDAHGRKMSKSLGNVITPQQVVQGATAEELQEEVEKSYTSGLLNENELQKSLQGLQKMFPNGIQECGTDALRFTLCSHKIKSHFINFNVNECYTNKLFLNKIWQATRFTLGAAEKLQFSLHEIENMNYVPLGLWDQWILSRLGNTLTTCTESIEEYNLHTATAAFKHFFYSNLCDVYLETTKSNISAANKNGYIHCATLATCLSWGLQAMLPFTPFIAHELLQHLPKDIKLHLSKFHNPTLEKEVTEILEICQAIRQLKSRNSISKKYDPIVHLFAQTTEALEMLQPHLAEIQVLTLTNGVELHLTTAAVNKNFEYYSTAGHLFSFGIATNDLLKKAAKSKSENFEKLNLKKLQRLEAELDRYRARVKNEGFYKSASKEVQQKHNEK